MKWKYPIIKYDPDYELYYYIGYPQGKETNIGYGETNAEAAENAKKYLYTKYR